MDTAFRAGTVLVGKYRVDGTPGRDGMCLVYRVTHLQSGEEVLLKVLRPETATSLTVHARFVREAQAALRLQGEHVARLFDVGVLPDGVPYAVTEAVRGPDLAAELARVGPLPPGQAADLALQVCDALAEVHACGIVHRDVRPASLGVTVRPDGTPLVKLLDTGICKAPLTAGGALASGEAAGTPGYMSPEQMKAIEDLDGRTDLWGLGIVLYELLTGQHPFRAATPAAAARMAAMAPPEPFDPRIPGGLQAIVFRCLDKAREARFPSAAALAAALLPFAHDQHAAALIVERASQMAQSAGPELAAVPGTYPVVLPPIAAPRPSRSRRRYAIIGAIALAVSIGGIATAALIGPERSRGPIDTLQADLQAHGVAMAPPGAASAGAPDTPKGAKQAGAERAAKPVSAGSLDAQLARCNELAAQKAWQALDACASEVGKLATADKAEPLHATAREERKNEIQAQLVHQSLRDGNLKGADDALQKMDDTSVYFPAARDAFAKVEQPRADEARRRAQAMAAAHDCDGLQRLVAQLAAAGTERIATAAREVDCEDKARPAERVAARSTERTADRTPERTADRTPDRTADRTPDRAADRTPDRAADRTPDRAADRTPDRAADRTPDRTPAPDRPAERAAARPEPAAAAQPRARGHGCEAVNVDDVMTRAAIQYDSGSPGAALSLARIALGCKQTDRMYWLAVLYACAAHDVASARQYFPKVPTNLQSGIESKCQRENLDVRTR